MHYCSRNQGSVDTELFKFWTPKNVDIRFFYVISSIQLYSGGAKIFEGIPITGTINATIVWRVRPGILVNFYGSAVTKHNNTYYGYYDL